MPEILDIINLDGQVIGQDDSRKPKGIFVSIF